MTANQIKGNIAERAIAYQLQRLAPDVRSVIPVPNQNDPNHLDITLLFAERFAPVHVQVKAVGGGSGIRLKAAHLEDWLAAAQPTVLMGWDEASQHAFWADILRYSIRRGASSSTIASFRKDTDLRRLDCSDPQSRAAFLSYLRVLCVVWRDLHREQTAILHPEFPVSLSEVFLDPTILLLLPTHAKLLQIAIQYVPPSSTDTAIAKHILATSRIALRSPIQAADAFMTRCGIPVERRDVHEEIVRAAAQWAERTAVCQLAGCADAIRGYDGLLSLLSYQKNGDAPFLAFEARATYPVGRFVQLVRPEAILGQLERILLSDTNAATLMHAAYYLGLLELPAEPQTWELARRLRENLHDREAREQRIGSMWSGVDRELLFVEAQLGSEQALSRYLDAVGENGAARFEAGFNHAYYRGNWEMIKTRFETRLAEIPRTDRYVHRVLIKSYDFLRHYKQEAPETLQDVAWSAWPLS